MARIKIISDPYRRQTEFLSWNSEWISIAETNPNSKLLDKRFTEGFFPFKAREIVDLLIEEYGVGNEVLEIVFEGPDDEWTELRDVCTADDLLERVALDRGERFLTNARDILPLIRDVFDELYPILAGQSDGNIETQEQLRKFRDASSNVVPVCVVGNYSAGKSSFINALIGIELLPSGDRPVTARIFQIERSEQQDRASIKFKYAGESVHLNLSDNGVTVSPEEFKDKLFEGFELSAVDNPTLSIPDRVRAILAKINSYKELDANRPVLSDLIEVKVPFGKGTDWDNGKKVIVFDTPGSNSSSNQDHARVLEDAMRGMSDGLPIYVTVYEALDSTDNANLYKEISEIPALDERFAMIVVNKADDADLPEGGFSNHEEWIMDTVVARNLYAQGIFFMSSIAGLGSKTGGDFSDRHYDRVYRRLKDSFENPEDKYYLRLYDYDLMPEQLRVKAVKQSEACENVVLANSGLFSVERGIDDFASKYSAYNKCFQSESLLRDLIMQTDRTLDDRGKMLENSWTLLKADLDASKDDLLDKFLQLSLSACEEAVTGYLPAMNEWSKKSIAETSLTTDTLIQWEDEITARKQREKGAEEKRRDAKGKRAAVAANLKSRVQNAVDTKDMLGFTAIAKSLMSDINAARTAESESEAIFRGADREASDILLERIRTQFDTDVARMSKEAEDQSKTYWGDRAETTRSTLLDFVSSGSSIDNGQREAFRSIIIDYHNLTLDSERPEIKEIRYPFDPNKLWKAPLLMQYNAELKQRLSMWRAIMEPEHEERYREWLHTLMDKLMDSAETINPSLKKKVDDVRSAEREIEALRSKRGRLHKGEKTVSGYMTWKKG